MSIRVEALRDLFARYGRVFAAAWAARDQLQGAGHRGPELAFLPAHLELAETPVHPAPRWAMRLIAGLAMLAVLLAVVGRLDIVVVAKGKLVPDDRVKIVQPALTGVVRQLLVADGQRVQAGQILMTLDTTQAAADADKARAAKVMAALAAARSHALLDAQAQDRDPLLAPVPGATEAQSEDARRFIAAAFHEYQAKLAGARAELARRQDELAGTLHDIDRLKATAPLAREQADAYQALVGDKYVSRDQYLDKEQSALQQEHDLAARTSHAAELREAIAEQRTQVAQLIAQFRREQLDDLDKANQQVTQSEDDETKAVTREHLLSLTAPVDGTVQQLAVHTLGGVVTTAQAVMEIVPDDALEVEAKVENKDVGFLKVGQPVVVKIDAFPYTRYGTLEGELRAVSNDAEQDKKQGLTFVAHIRLPAGRMRVDGRWIALTPGMTVSAEVRTGRRSVVGYFLDPLMETSQESLRER